MIEAQQLSTSKAAKTMCDEALSGLIMVNSDPYWFVHSHFVVLTIQIQKSLWIRIYGKNWMSQANLLSPSFLSMSEYLADHFADQLFQLT